LRYKAVGKYPTLDAILISCVRTRRLGGIDEITHVGGKLSDGTPWLASFESVVEQIESGRRYFVASPAESMLVSVVRERDGRKVLGVGVEASPSRLLDLPRDPS
jgi:hypothetical protein